MKSRTYDTEEFSTLVAYPCDSAEHLQSDEDIKHYIEACFEEADEKRLAWT